MQSRTRMPPRLRCKTIVQCPVARPQSTTSWSPRRETEPTESGHETEQRSSVWPPAASLLRTAGLDPVVGLAREDKQLLAAAETSPALAQPQLPAPASQSVGGVAPKRRGRCVGWCPISPGSRCHVRRSPVRRVNWRLVKRYQTRSVGEGSVDARRLRSQDKTGLQNHRALGRCRSHQNFTLVGRWIDMTECRQRDLVDQARMP